MLEALENIFDINFSPDIDIQFLNFTKNEGGDRFQPDGRTLHLNIDELSPAELQQLQQVSQERFEEKGRVLRDDEEDETSAIEAGYSEDLDDIVDYFEPVLNDRYHSILGDSLYLRSLISQRDLSKEEIQERKRDLARKYGPDAVYLSSLATAGYFDENGGLRDLFVTMGLNEQYDKYNFQRELEDLVEDRLLCVFVQNNDEVYEVTQEVRGKLARYQQVEPIHDWLDIRGIGDGCEEIIDAVVQNLEEEFIGIDLERWNSEYGVAVRIRPHSLPPISS